MSDVNGKHCSFLKLHFHNLTQCNLTRSCDIQLKGPWQSVLDLCSISTDRPYHLQMVLKLDHVLTLIQGFPNFSVHDPQNNSAREWGRPSTLEVAYNVVYSCAHTPIQHRHQYNTKEQQPNSHIINLK